MTGMVSGDLDSFSLFLKNHWLPNGRDFHTVVEGAQVGSPVNGELRQVELAALALHYCQGIGQHPANEHGTWIAQENGSPGVKTGEEGEAA